VTTRAVKVYLTAASQGTDFGQDTARYAMNLERPEWTYQWIPGDVTTTDGINVLGYTGGTPGAWRRLAHEDQGATLTDASTTIYVSGDTWRRLPAGTLTTDRTLTLGTTNTRAGYDIVVSVEGTGAYTYAVANGGTAGGTLVTFAGPGFIHAQYDGTDWKVRGFGGNVVSGASVAAQSAWYINPSTGSDSATGSSSAPLRTAAEFFRRVRGVTLTAATITVTIQGALSETINGDITLGTAVALTFVGSRATVLSGTLTSGTRNWDIATPQDGRVIDSALATSWTSSLGANINGLMSITTAGGAATAWIAKDLGSKTARISNPQLSDYSSATIANGNAYTVSTLTAFGTDVTLNLKCGHDSYVAFQDLNIGTAGSAHAVEVIGGSVNFITCQVNGLDVFGNTTASGLGSKYVEGPRSQQGAALNSYNDLALGTSSSAQSRVGAQFFGSNLLCQGMQFVVASAAADAVIATDSWLAVYDPAVAAGGNGIDVLMRGSLKIAGRAFGTCQTIAPSGGSIGSAGVYADIGGFVGFNSGANRAIAITGGHQDTYLGPPTTGVAKSYVQLGTAGHYETSTGTGIVGTTFPRG
jgi:hypothetical protein